MISVVIPIFNEEPIVNTLLHRVVTSLEALSQPFEIICVDDGSKDESLARLKAAREKDRRVKIISLSRNFGHQQAFLAGISHAKGDYIVMMDGDLQDPPELIGKFLQASSEGGYDVVYGIRKKRKEGFFKRLAYWFFYRIFRASVSFDIPLDTGDFSMITRKALNEILSSHEQSLFLRGTRSWVGFRQTGIEYERDKRYAGEVKYTFRKLAKLAYNGIFSFSDLPVKFIFFSGVVLLVLSFVYLLYLVVSYFFLSGVPQGFSTLVTVIIVFSSVQLISLGVIGEYLLRIYDESRRRPLFIVKDMLFD
jgi:dolichol-phosphate mannosyltransferase